MLLNIVEIDAYIRCRTIVEVILRLLIIKTGMMNDYTINTKIKLICDNKYIASCNFRLLANGEKTQNTIDFSLRTLFLLCLNL